MKNTIKQNSDNRPKVVVSQHLNKVSERIDANGNVIDPRTKQIIKKNTE